MKVQGLIQHIEGCDLLCTFIGLVGNLLHLKWIGLAILEKFSAIVLQ
jgi:hypothetical protein